ncbi:hypothetical protein QJS10_CPA02g00915 [Acorus calamus]|uniref:Uncharacterized protein n=1 Tax=Acorus calamus TaxID=4465 RepID=A0AAV9FA12_ACOCL|nr:hypothetical protein QJS10_CPA02g00915 [Acorus calamus]
MAYIDCGGPPDKEPLGLFTAAPRRAVVGLLRDGPSRSRRVCFRRPLLEPSGFRQDVCPPLSRLGECISRSKQLVDALPLVWDD